MTEGPQLFQPIQLREVTLANRIVVSPMCQYSADDGSATDWHIHHLGSMAISGASLVVLEATGVERDGRITPGCLGLYSDENEAAIGRALKAARSFGKALFGIQLAHAGRKASSHVPWKGGGPLGANEAPWQTMAPSAIPFGENWPTPMQLDRAGMIRVRDAFAKAAERAARLGIEVAELHSAHGYLMHSFVSPISNRRRDEYGGSRENRMRFPLEIAAAVREVWPKHLPLGARITGHDWLEGGLEVEDAVAYSLALKRVGVDFICVSSGGVQAKTNVKVGPAYQTPFAARVKAETGMPTRAVGMIVAPKQAEEIVATGKADMIALARVLLYDPRWPWHAAEELGGSVPYPPQYARSAPKIWPGAALARELA
jgi:2,4-dienoyl-CoA reductase-like NADH-dependent reductase (Old Yellow Enzyme family)